MLLATGLFAFSGAATGHQRLLHAWCRYCVERHGRNRCRFKCEHGRHHECHRIPRWGCLSMTGGKLACRFSARGAATKRRSASSMAGLSTWAAAIQFRIRVPVCHLTRFIRARSTAAASASRFPTSRRTGASQNDANITMAFYGRGGMNTDWDDPNASATSYFCGTTPTGASRNRPGSLSCAARPVSTCRRLS